MRIHFVQKGLFRVAFAEFSLQLAETQKNNGLFEELYKLLFIRTLKTQKIQGMYFKIKGTYFKIYGLYFLRSPLCFFRQALQGLRK